MYAIFKTNLCNKSSSHIAVGWYRLYFNKSVKIFDSVNDAYTYLYSHFTYTYEAEGCDCSAEVREYSE